MICRRNANLARTGSGQRNLITAPTARIHRHTLTKSLDGLFFLWRHNMDAILAHIAANWVEWLFAAALGILAFAWRMVSGRLKEEHERNVAIADGVQSLLRESIVSNYNRYSDKGFCPIYAKESVKKVYHAYHDLGGNDIATDLYHKLLELPTERKGDKNEADKQDV